MNVFKIKDSYLSRTLVLFVQSDHLRSLLVDGPRSLDTACLLWTGLNVYFLRRLVLRFRCDAKVSQLSLGNKFGCDALTEAPRLMQLACDLGLVIVGVSFHVGTDCGEPAVFRRAIAAAGVLFDLGNSLGYDMNVLDLGGGFPGKLGTLFDEVSTKLLITHGVTSFNICEYLLGTFLMNLLWNNGTALYLESLYYIQGWT